MDDIVEVMHELAHFRLMAASASHVGTTPTLTRGLATVIVKDTSQVTITGLASNTVFTHTIEAQSAAITVHTANRTFAGYTVPSSCHIRSYRLFPGNCRHKLSRERALLNREDQILKGHRRTTTVKWVIISKVKVAIQTHIAASSSDICPLPVR